MSIEVSVVDMSDLNSLIERYKVSANEQPAGLCVPPGTVFANGEEAIDPGVVAKLCGLRLIVSELVPSANIYILSQKDVDEMRRF